MGDDRDHLTIGEVETRTGVPVATLRSWEQRFGFPAPLRSTGGQRRYTAAQVEQVRQVLAERARGLGLAAAVAAVTAASETPVQRSVFADLRAAHPHLDVMTVGARVMNDLSYAIEDECLAHATRPVLLGCFQTEASYERAGDRWRELGRRARRAVAISDFAATDATGRPEKVALPTGSPLLAEWGLVCQDADLMVALVAWERLPAAGETRRTFEAVVSVDHAVVRDAAARYAQAVREAGLPDPERLVPAGPSTEVSAERSLSLLRRFAAYADR